MQGWLIISLFLFGGFAVLFALFRFFSGGRRTHVKDATGNIIIGDVHGKAEQDYRPTVAAPPPIFTTTGEEKPSSEMERKLNSTILDASPDANTLA